jgi:predicted MFS family arabinose efflux permease
VNPVFTPGGRAWFLFLLLATYTCGFIDRVIVATLGPAITADLGLSDLQFGLLGGLAFAVFYSAFGLPVARLAERRSRVNIIAWSVAIWSAMTALCGLAASYWQLLLCRMGVGVGEAGCTPPAASLISDLYPARERASALSIYSLGVPLGTTIGAIAGGWLAQTVGWRAAFLIVGLPGLLLALVVKLTLREPPRGHADGRTVPEEAPPLGAVIRRLRGRTSSLHILAGCAVTTLANNGIILFTPSYFVRRFEMGMADVGLVYGLILGTASTAGLLAGGFGVDLGAKRDVRWYAWIPAGGVLVAAPCFLLAYTRDTPVAAFAFVLAGVLAVSAYWAPSFAYFQNVVEPRMRASVTALLLLAMNVLGQGLGPMVMGLLSDLSASRAFSTFGSYQAICLGGDSALAGVYAAACAEASAAGLQTAIVWTSMLFVWGAVHYALAARLIVPDTGSEVGAGPS